MKAIVFDRFGEPAEVLRVGEAAAAEPGAGQVRVRMLASPINPSDLLSVRGMYGKLPRLPATPGFEGVGVVDKAGPGFLKWLRGLKPGRRVAVLNGNGGNWQQQVIVPARVLVPVPSDLRDEQVACFFVNPATALIMTRWLLKVPRGGWLLQTAAASELGKMVIRLGKHHGFRTLNVVRRREQAEMLLKLGGDAAVATNDENLDERVRSLTGGEGVGYAIDAVGGQTALAALRCLGTGGRMLVYGTLANEPMPVDTRLLISGQKRIEGFWLSEWVRMQGIPTMLRLFREIKKLMRAGVLVTDIGQSFPMEEIAAAARLAETPGRPGKVLIRLG
ncbi:MAG: zinc-dependent alcohol dehydrogenase family protein [Planctomycetes bacterium]|nr:zinc-dependent alcohol dehydrogenase family protein [Planctomycetota bacterium]